MVNKPYCDIIWVSKNSYTTSSHITLPNIQNYSLKNIYDQICISIEDSNITEYDRKRMSSSVYSSI